MGGRRQYDNVLEPAGPVLSTEHSTNTKCREGQRKGLGDDERTWIFVLIMRSDF